MDIYLITCKITNKKYIGQTNIKQGYLKRWQQHKSRSSNCTLLRNAIQKYGVENFTIECLVKCESIISDYYEKKFIIIYNTGGNKQKKLSSQTKEKMSQSKLGHKPYYKMTSEISNRISKSLVSYNDINPKVKKDHNGNNLPKYISIVKKNDKIIGYSIFNHKTGFRKKITSCKLSLDEKLNQILTLE